MKQIDLGGTWEFRRTGGTWDAWLKASVPGCVHTDLMANGLMDDPFVRMNELDVLWVDKATWEYRRTFDVPAAPAPSTEQAGRESRSVEKDERRFGYEEQRQRKRDEEKLRRRLRDAEQEVERLDARRQEILIVHSRDLVKALAIALSVEPDVGREHRNRVLPARVHEMT